MAENRGKQFETVIRNAFEAVIGCSVDRLHDQTNGFKGSQNICDFILYKYPNEIYLECKSCVGNTFPLSNITDTQLLGLLRKSSIPGVKAGVMVWWVSKDTTRYIPITDIVRLKDNGAKSIRFDTDLGIEVKGKKKRVFFDYYVETFLEELCQTEMK